MRLSDVTRRGRLRAPRDLRRRAALKLAVFAPDSAHMRNLILGVIVAVWGAAVVFNGLILSKPEGEGAYHTGQVVGIGVGAVMAVVGVRAVLRSRRDQS